MLNPLTFIRWLVGSEDAEEWVASLFRPSEVKTAGKAMANHPKMPMPENWVLYDLVTKGL